MSNIIRPATRNDVPILRDLIYEFAEYVKHECIVRVEQLASEMFGERPVAEALIAEADGEPVGFAIFFPTFSTFSGRKRLYLEDLFVRPDARGKGIGMALFRAVAQAVLARDCAVLEWSVLDWNTPAQEFYTRLGAEPMDEYTIYRLSQEQMKKL